MAGGDFERSPESAKSIGGSLSRESALLGLLQTRTNPLLPELAVQCGYDFLILDCQSGRFEEREFGDSLQAILDQPNLRALVRLPNHDAHLAERSIRLGAHAIVAPRVETPGQAKLLVSAIGADRNSELIVILESTAGANSAPDILAVEGVDGALVGPTNLSAALGRPGAFEDPVFLEALAQIEDAAASHGKYYGTVPRSSLPISMLRTRGHRLFILSSDHMLLRDAMIFRSKSVRDDLVVTPIGGNERPT